MAKGESDTGEVGGGGAKVFLLGLTKDIDFILRAVGREGRGLRRRVIKLYAFLFFFWYH